MPTSTVEDGSSPGKWLRRGCRTSSQLTLTTALAHLLGHHAGWGPRPLLQDLIVVRVIWEDKRKREDLEARTLGLLGLLPQSHPQAKPSQAEKDSHPHPSLAVKTQHRRQEMLFIPKDRPGHHREP